MIGNWLFMSKSQSAKRIKTRLKIVGATASAIFSLFAAFTASYAWFASQNTVTATGMSVSVSSQHVSLENVSLYKFNYGTTVYESFTVVDYLDPSEGSVNKYDYDEESGNYLDAGSHSAVKMNMYDPMQSIILGSTLGDLHCNIILKVDIEASGVTSANMDLNAFRLVDKTKTSNQIFLSDCVDFDVFFQSDLDAVTDRTDYYPSYISTGTNMTDEQSIYYKISYLSSEAATHQHFYGGVSTPVTVPLLSDESVTFSNDRLSVYININYSPSQLQGYASEIYARTIEAVYDFNFEFLF